MPPEGFHEGTLENLNRSYYLLLHSCGALLDELLGDAGAAASGTDGEGFGLGQQLVVGISMPCCLASSVRMTSNRAFSGRWKVTVRPNRAERLISS